MSTHTLVEFSFLKQGKPPLIYALRHGVTDLCGTGDGLADPVAPASHHLLGDEDFLCWDFNAQVATGNHDAITSLQDLIKSIRQKHIQEKEFSNYPSNQICADLTVNTDNPLTCAHPHGSPAC